MTGHWARQEKGVHMAKPIRAAVVIAVTAVALTACGGGSTTGGSGGAKTLVIATDLPLQGASKDASDSTNNAIQLYLDQVGNKAGSYTIQLKKYDDSTAAKGQWDDATCAKNAQDHVANTSEVAVMGTYNSGCAKIEVPVLNAAGMLMVSHANTNPGLTKAWDANEPAKYYPSGKRTYARVITTDDYQGAAAATYMASKLNVKKVYILNDNQTYGQGVAKAFAGAAPKNGMTVLGNEAWDKNQPNYTALFNKIKALAPDAVYLAGIYDNNGGQLVKDKVSVLGDNTGVKLMAPDGFTGYPALQKLPQGEGLYLSFTGLTVDQLKVAGGSAAKLLTDYKAKYNSELATSFALYGVAAVQVLLAAIEKSDGTRKGVLDQVFSGAGVTIPADKAVTGTEIKIDPASGDIISKTISIQQLKGGKETFLQAQPVT
jgi:branched-chain amino acid transport system substrate-binding protein